MQFADFDEFWNPLGRLKNERLEVKESIEKLPSSIEADHNAIELLAGAVQKDHDLIMANERRLDRTEIAVEAILEDLRCHRKQRPSQ